MAARGQIASASLDAAVVDTDVVSFLFKGSKLREAYEPHLVNRLLVVSYMTVAELDFWALWRRWGDRRTAELERQLNDEYVLYPVTRALCHTWAEVRESARRHGYTISTADAWIAATALANDIPLVTHNRDDFRGITGLHLISES